LKTANNKLEEGKKDLSSRHGPCSMGYICATKVKTKKCMLFNIYTN